MHVAQLVKIHFKYFFYKMFRPRAECIRLPQNKSNKHTEFRYTCKICEEGGWVSETELEIHNSEKHLPRLRKMALQSNEKPICLTCITEHEDSKSLIKHIKSEHLLSSEDSRRVEREIFVCNYCQQIFFNKNHIEIHISFKHLFKKIFKCPLCPRKVKINSLWGHFQLHQLQSVSSCPICLVKCTNRLHLRDHLESHRKFFHCHVCDYKTNSNNNFEQHKCFVKSKDNNIVDYKKYFVQPKDKSRWTHSVVRNPVKGLCLWNKLFICIICREICTSNNGMREHMNKDHSLGELVVRKRHRCLCGEEFCNGVLLKYHVFKMKRSHRILHEGEEPNGSLADIEELIVLEDSDDLSFTEHSEDVLHTEQTEDVLITEQTEVVVLTEQTQDFLQTRQPRDVLITEQTQLVLLTEETQDVPFTGQADDDLITGLPQDVIHTVETRDFLITEQTQDVLPTVQTQNVTYTGHNQDVLYPGQTQDGIHTELLQDDVFSDSNVVTTEIMYPNRTPRKHRTSKADIGRSKRSPKLKARVRSRPRRQ